GIRDFHVTGVQTCALPIYDRLADRLDGASGKPHPPGRDPAAEPLHFSAYPEPDRGDRRAWGAGLRRGAKGRLCREPDPAGAGPRSEERRVGKGWRAAATWW